LLDKFLFTPHLWRKGKVGLKMTVSQAVQIVEFLEGYNKHFASKRFSLMTWGGCMTRFLKSSGWQWRVRHWRASGSS
jgi:hypothetical protein